MARKYQRISADCHLDMLWLPPDLFTSNASSKLRDLMPYVAENPDGVKRWTDNNGAEYGLCGGVGATGTPHVPGKQLRADKMAEAGLYSDYFEKGLRRPGDPHLRVKDMDRDGVDDEVIYGILAACAKMKDPEAADEMLRIYNAFMHAFSATYPQIARWLDPRAASATSSCIPDDTSLCLNDGRFRVRIQWTTGTGTTGAGHAVALTGDTGYFWFFAPTNVEVLGYVPHAELMPAASLLVGNGGHGTTLQALAHDLPVVVMPMDGHADQPLVGRRLEEAGAGRVVAKRSTPAQLTPVLAAMLADGPHRAAAARLGAAVRALPGAVRGADALEVLLRDGAGTRGRPSARR